MKKLESISLEDYRLAKNPISAKELFCETDYWIKSEEYFNSKMKELKGSEKQIKWANDIREEKKDQILTYLCKIKYEGFKLVTVDFIKFYFLYVVRALSTENSSLIIKERESMAAKCREMAAKTCREKGLKVTVNEII